MEVLPTDTPSLFTEAVQRSARLLRQGRIVAIPTETVYGLAANALDPVAVERIYEAKGRPRKNPIIVHVASLEMARECVREWPEMAARLAAAFWPGPLTLVLPRSARVPEIVTAGGDTVGVRWPSHPFAQALIRECGFPLAAPSANLAGQVSPTTAAHVCQALGHRVPLIVDGGPSQVGIESTVLDVTADPPRVLRPGMIHAESLLAVTGELADASAPGGGVLRSPGLLRRHYAPRARLVLRSWENEAELAVHLGNLGARPATTHCVAHSHVPRNETRGQVVIIPHDAEAFARAIYAELHRCDAAGAEWIVVEQPPDRPEWRAITDRLRRASVGSEPS